MNNEEFELIVSYPLDLKIEKSKLRIREAVQRFGLDGVYISYSGGKDSTVLLHLARQEFPGIKAVFCDTGLEFPELKEFVLKQEGIEVIRPKLNFKEILIKYGYPIVSKEQAHFLDDIRRAKSPKTIDLRLNGNKNGNFKLSKKWRYLMDAPFKVSHKCCYHMKKSPFKKYERKTGRIPILGTRAAESRLRRTEYLQNGGCNSFDTLRPKSQPISFWTEQDVLNYIVLNDLEIPSVYGDIVPDYSQTDFLRDDTPQLKCSGANRTGCIFCGFGCHLEGEPNRYQRLKETHPKLYDYVINGGEYVDGFWQPSSEGLGFGKVLDYINVRYK